MRRNLAILVFCISFSCLSFGQDYTFLESKNGFRNIRLGTSVDNYPEFKLKNEANIDLFKLSMNLKTSHVYKGTDHDKIASARILFIYLITENNIITEIRIVTEKVLNVYSTLENAYGKPTDTQGTKLIWRTDKIECSIEGDNTQLPGYHIRYKALSKERVQLNELREKSKKEAQAEL
jgi:hypothetical protein